MFATVLRKHSACSIDLDDEQVLDLDDDNDTIEQTAVQHHPAVGVGKPNSSSKLPSSSSQQCKSRGHEDVPKAGFVLATSVVTDVEARFLRQCLHNAGASDAEVAAWASAIDGSVRLQFSRSHDAKDAKRFCRAEARRVGTALKDKAIAASLFQRMRAGELQASAICSLPPEDLLTGVKRARLQDLRAADKYVEKQEFPFHDPSMPCSECGKVGVVRYRYDARTSEARAMCRGLGKDAKGEAKCSECFAEWTFDADFM